MTSSPLAPSWGQPFPFTDIKLPPFPIDALPRLLRNMAEAVAEQTQTPLELPAFALLGATSIALAKKVELEVQPNWREPVNLYAVVVQEPGTRKSPVVQIVTQPLQEWERRERQRSRAARQEAEALYEVSKERLKIAINQAAKAAPEEREKLERLAVEAQRDAEEAVPPAPPRLLAEDVTPEKLVSLLAENHGRMGVISAEGGLVDIMRGRYSNGMPNLDVYLKAHRGEDLLLDRISRAGSDVRKPALTLVLAVQRDVLKAMTSNDVLHGRGLLARFLYAVPQDKLGARNVHAQAVPVLVLVEYRMLLRALLAVPFTLGNPNDPIVLKFTPEAHDLFKRFELDVEGMMADGGDLQYFKEWGGKLAGTAARLATLLHCAQAVEAGRAVEGPTAFGGAVEPGAVEDALRIARYLIPHMRRAFFEMRNLDGAARQAMAVADWIRRKGLTEFAPRDLQRSFTHAFRRAKDTRPCLEVLAEYDYVRLNGKGAYIVNPRWLQTVSADMSGSLPDTLTADEARA